MYTKVSAQKIRSLELRIAKLEKEAGVTELISNLGRKILNYPKNFIKRITDALKDIGSQLEVLFWGSLGGKNVLRESLATQLEIRIRNALQGGISTFKDLPSISNLVVSNPMKSQFIQIVDGRPKKMNVSDLAKYYGGVEGKSIKFAYLSWEKDFESILDGIAGRKLESASIKRNIGHFLNFLKRTSKLAYRIMKTLLAIGGVGFFITIDWAAWMATAGIVIFNVMSGVMLPASGAIVGKSLLGNISMGFIPALMNIIEKAFIKFGVNVDAFDTRVDKMASLGASYPNIRVALAQLEQGI